MDIDFETPGEPGRGQPMASRIVPRPTGAVHGVRAGTPIDAPRARTPRWP